MTLGTFFAANSTNIILMLIAAFNALAAWFAWQGREAAIASKAVAVETKEISVKTHDSTNSKMDLLLKTLGEERFRAGQDDARKEGEVKAAALLAGQQQAGLAAAPSGPIGDLAKETVVKAEATVVAAKKAARKK